MYSAYKVMSQWYIIKIMHMHMIFFSHSLLRSPSLPIPTTSDLVQLIESIQAKHSVKLLTGDEVLYICTCIVCPLSLVLVHVYIVCVCV